MYTVQSYTDAKNTELRSRLISVIFVEPYQEEVLNEETQLMELVDRERIKVQEFRFSIDVEEAKIKAAVKAFKDELNFTPVPITGAIDDVPTEAEVVPTADELARTEWDRDRNNLKTLMDLVRDGVFTGSETQITALQAKVKAGFKVGYLG